MGGAVLCRAVGVRWLSSECIATLSQNPGENERRMRDGIDVDVHDVSSDGSGTGGAGKGAFLPRDPTSNRFRKQQWLFERVHYR